MPLSHRQLAHFVGIFVTAWVTLASPFPIPYDIVVGTVSGVLAVGIVMMIMRRGS